MLIDYLKNSKKRQIDVVENSAAQIASDREQRLEKKLNHAEAKVAKLNAQLDANRRTNQKLTDEKLEYQANCRAAQERATHAETRLSELIGQNTILQDQLKEARKPKTGPGPRECQKEELKQGLALCTFIVRIVYGYKTRSKCD